MQSRHHWPPRLKTTTTAAGIITSTRSSVRIVDTAPYNLQLDHGPHIFLHDGTVIRPRGLTLRNGMRVKVVGHQNEGGFAADEVDLLRHRDFNHD